jgi:hypothetical protein
MNNNIMADARDFEAGATLTYSMEQSPSCRTMALGSTQPLKKMSTRIISWGVKAACA